MRKLIPLFAVITAMFLAGCTTTPPSSRGIANNTATDPYSIPEFNYKLNDISTLNVTKEKLFNEMDPNRIIKNGASICSNRALMWGWNLKRMHNIDSGKVFVFYTRGFFSDPEYRNNAGAPASVAALEEGEEEAVDEKQWWYHVAPYVVENGKEFVLDHGFSANVSRADRMTPAGEITQGWKGPITRPLTIKEWLLRFPKVSTCQEITGDDKQFADNMRRGVAFPGPKDGGKNRCYFRKIPAMYWTPLSVYMNESGMIADGKTAANPPFVRDNFWEGDILRACEEAVSEDGKIAKLFGRGAHMETCLNYLGLDKTIPSYAGLTSLQSFDKSIAKRKEKAMKRLQKFFY